MTEKRQTSQGYIIRILQHFATKLWNIRDLKIDVANIDLGRETAVSGSALEGSHFILIKIEVRTYTSV